MSTSTPRQGRPELTDAAVVSRSWGLALATLVSRITGFVRIVALAAILGAALSSAFSVANQLPNQIAALVLEATFTAIFVPVLARAERDDPDGGAAFVRRLVTLATALLLVTTVISVVAAPLLVKLMLGGHSQVNEPLTIAFAYLLLPQVICYGLSSVFMAILNNRNIFRAPAWAPVVNNVVAIATLVLYVLVPGELSVDPVHMGNAKLLVLGLGTTAGVVAQTAVLLVAIRRERISLRPLWGIDDRIKRFGTMAAAMVLYVLISQIGLVVTNQIASTSAASGPAIYYYAWLLLQLPFGMIGVTVLTVVMPRLSRNAAAGDDPAVLADLSLATRLMMITLIPIVALMTVGGRAIGSALFAYGNFGDVDAGYLGAAVSMSAFTLLPYAMVLLQLRVFYAREQPWIPIAIIVVITAVKIAASVLAPHLTDDPDLVAAYLGLANGLGFLAGAIVGHSLLRRALFHTATPGVIPARSRLLGTDVLRTVLVTVTASLLAGLIAEVLDRVSGLHRLTDHGAGGSLLRLVVLSAVMVPIIAAVLVGAHVPEALAALAAVRGKLTGSRPHARTANPASPGRFVPYADHDRLLTPGRSAPAVPPRYTSPADIAGSWTPKGAEVVDQPSESAGIRAPSQSIPAEKTQRPTTGTEPVTDDSQLTPGLSIAGGRYRLLVHHGGTPIVQFWQAMDTALDRQVALTFIDPDQSMPEDQLNDILARTQRLSQVSRSGIARVLDVVRIGSGGLVVSEWVRGASLQEVAGTAPSPVGAARAVRSLAGAAEAAHQAGAALSIDNPSRVRVSIDGDVTLAFPATLPETTPQDDIRGIGATLYALLVNRWPLPITGADCGLAPADRDAAGNPVTPESINADIPFQISAAASHAIQPDGGIRGAATLLNLLQQATSLHEQTDLLGPVTDEPPAPPPAPVPDPEMRAERRRRLLIGAGIGGSVILIALLVLASVLNRMFGDVNGLDQTELGLNNPSASALPGAEPPGTVRPIHATVFSPGGDADRPQDAGLAIDGNPTTFWGTDTYSDAVPFPNFKNGVGLILQLPRPTVIASVGINVSSTGTRVELRSSPTAEPAKLDDTTLLAPAKTLQPGANTISLDSTTPTTYLLVWICTMGNTGGESRTQISEITVQAAES